MGCIYLLIIVVAGTLFMCISRLIYLMPGEDNNVLIILVDNVFIYISHEYDLVPPVFAFDELVMEIYHEGSSRTYFSTSF